MQPYLKITVMVSVVYVIFAAPPFDMEMLAIDKQAQPKKIQSGLIATLYSNTYST